MANIRDIKNRIESIISTKQITNAMKMVAAAKLRRAQNSIFNARPYANYINVMLQTLKLKNKTSAHPLLNEVNINGKKALIVVTADRGLCGSFNFNIIRKSLNIIEENPALDVICIGKSGYDHIKKKTDKIIKYYINIFNEMNFAISKEISTYLLDLYFNVKGKSKNVLSTDFLT